MRQKNISTFLALIVIIGLVASVTEAGSKKRRGTAGAQELLIPAGSRGTAMAGAYVAGISGLEAIEWNMAGLSGMSNNGQAMSSYSSWIADIGVTSAAIASSFGVIVCLVYHLNHLILAKSRSQRPFYLMVQGRAIHPVI
jgi:hypothetical protein